MTQLEAPARQRRRAVPREERREQLIKATINCVAKYGFSETTMAVVTREAGLSLGIVNLHFKSKDLLLEETLHYLSDEYESAYQQAMLKAGPNAVDKLQALVDLDFGPRVCVRKKLAVWFAFWGEARSRPKYLEICANNDNKYNQVIADLAKLIINEGNYKNVNANIFANTLSALVNGLWLDILMTPDALSREEAHSICMNYLTITFPKHYSLT